MPTILYGARMYHFFASEDVAVKKLKDFYGMSEKQELRKDCIEWLNTMFVNDEDDNFSLIIPDGKKGDKLTPEKCLMNVVKKLKK